MNAQDFIIAVIIFFAVTLSIDYVHDKRPVDYQGEREEDLNRILYGGGRDERE